MLSIRNINGYAISSFVPRLTVKQVAAYALAIPGKVVPKGKTGKQILLDLMNANSFIVFTEENCIIESPVDIRFQGFNSRVLVKPTGDLPYLGSVNLRYNRVLIERSFLDSRLLGFTIDTDTTIHQLLPAINASHNLQLVSGDIRDEPVIAGSVYIRLAAAETSYIYDPTSAVFLGNTENPGPAVNLSESVTVLQLSGFEAA